MATIVLKYRFITHVQLFIWRIHAWSVCFSIKWRLRNSELYYSEYFIIFYIIFRILYYIIVWFWMAPHVQKCLNSVSK